jgi:hypothetical protein
VKVPFYLQTAIEEAFGPDPYLEKPDPQTVEAVALLVLYMAAVSKVRGPERAREPWKQVEPDEHAAHAIAHLHSASHSIEFHDSTGHLDFVTGLPQLAHAGLRTAFTLWLIREELT